MSDSEGEIVLSGDSSDDSVLDKYHWTDVMAEILLSDDSGPDKYHWSEGYEDYDDGRAEILLENPFFSDFDDLILGHKIGEGGQAEIYSATSQSHRLSKLVANVFKSGYLLRDLEKQWPPQMLSTLASRSGFPFEHILGGALLDDGRFAFVMEERWGSLRKLIDIRCRRRSRKWKPRYRQHAPPFSNDEVIHILWSIASDLKALHDADVMHRDIKASNVLLLSEEPNVVHLIDFEVSVGVCGTRFWRAREILKVMLQRNWGEFVFTKECDIYSFGMLSYEMITGWFPFENLSTIDCNSMVEERHRPELPLNLNPALKNLVHDCWQHDPQERPCVTDVVDRLVVLMRNPHQVSFSC